MDERQINLPGWKIIREIGRGSFGSVYEIEKEDEFGNGLRSALKVISIPESDTEIESYRYEGLDEVSITKLFKSRVEDITNEFLLMSKLKGNSNIVSYEDHTIIQHDHDPGYDILIRMELLTPMLKRFMNRTVQDEDVRKLGIDICQALELCEYYHIIHRDIKPQNIFVNDTGNYKLGDFGIAKTSDHTTKATKTGTYSYMAPEVYWGKQYNASVDLYSLGLVMYEMLNERRGPFMPLPPVVANASQREEALQRRMNGEPLPAPKHGSEELKRIVLKACAYDPRERYTDATTLKHDLEQLTTRKGSYDKEDPTVSIANTRTISTNGQKEERTEDRTVSTASAGRGYERPLPDADATVGILLKDPTAEHKTTKSESPVLTQPKYEEEKKQSVPKTEEPRTSLRENSENEKKDELYRDAMRRYNRHEDSVFALTKAAETFEHISGWRDSDIMAEECRARVRELNEKAERERRSVKKAGKIKRIVGIALGALVLAAIVGIVCMDVFTATEEPAVPVNDISGEALILQSFLEYECSDGIKNGCKINSNYRSDDISTWTGVTWEDEKVKEIFWVDAELDYGYGLQGVLDLSGFDALTDLDLYFNELEGLILRNCTALEGVMCARNQLTQLDVSGCTALTYLACDSNQLKTLDVSSCRNLEHLDCFENKLTNLNLTGCTKLSGLLCYDNELTQLNLSRCAALTSLDCMNNRIAELDIGSCPNLLETEVHCDSGVMLLGREAEDVLCLRNFLEYVCSDGVKNGSKLNPDYDPKDTSTWWGVTFVNGSITKIEWIAMENGKENKNESFGLEGVLDLRGCTRLEWLKCNGNNLTGLDVSECKNLGLLECSYNELDEIDLSNCPLLYELECSGNNLTELDLSNNKRIANLFCSENKLTRLDLSDCTMLRQLRCVDNLLKEINLSGCTALLKLRCGQNLLPSIDLKDCVSLTYISCYMNQIADLNISTCTALTELHCSSNQLKKLDLRNNTALKELDCHANSLRTLDLRACYALEELDCKGNPLTVLNLPDHFIPEFDLYS